MSQKNVSKILLLACVLLSLAILPYPTSADVFQPRSDQLIIYSYSDPTAAYTALKAGEIDFYAFPLTGDQYDDAITDPNIVVAPTLDLRMREFDLNNNYSLGSRPESVYGLSPTSYLGFRKALTYLADKDYVVEVVMEGRAERIDVPLSANPAHVMWYNESVTGPNWPYAFDTAEANTILDDEFPEGTTANPHYDVAFPGSAEFIRTYPTGHLKAGEDLDPIIFYARSDAPPRYAMAELLRDNMLKSGIPVDFIPATFAGIYGPVLTLKDYQIYTGGWSLGRFPTTLFFLYHSMWWNPIAPWPNQVCPPGLYPDLDAATYSLYNAQSYAEAETAAKNTQSIFVENCITIPVFTPESATSYTADLLGGVSQDGTGLENAYTLINAYRAGGGPVRMGLATPAIQLNPFYSSAAYDYNIMDRLFQALITVAPYDILTDQPWIAQDWERGQWIDGTETKDKLTYWFRKDWYWQDGTPFTAADYKFSMQLLYQCDDAWNWDASMDIHHIKIVDDKTVEAYMDLSNIWLLYFPIYPLIPKHKWQRAPITTDDIPIVEAFHEGTNVTTPGSVPLSELPCWFDSVTADGVPLVEGTDYDWVRGELVIYTDLPDCTDVVVTYWGKGEVTGVTPGLLPWNEVLVSCGQWMITEYNDPTMAGGWAVMEPNPYSSIATPLGEVDWRWNWVAGPKPRSGYYKIDIYDVVAACKAYGTSGTGSPPPEWGRPTADLAPPGGLINIYDVVTITGKYEQTFGQPPP